MNENLKTLHAELAEIRDAQSKLAVKLGDIGAERHEIETAASARAAAVSAAEQELVDQLALEEVGEQSDAEGARQRLNAARVQVENGVEAAQRLRVLDALRARFESDNQALHEKGVGLIAEIAAAEVEILRAKATALRDEAAEAMRLIARVDLEIPALRRLIEARGSSLPLPPLPGVEAIVEQHRMSMIGRNVAAELLAELEAA